MVQIVDMVPRPSISGAFGSGFEGGIASGFNAGLNYKMQEMLEAKHLARQQDIEGRKGLAALKLLSPGASAEDKAAAYALGPQHVEAIIKQRGSDAVRSLFSGTSSAAQANRPPTAYVQPETNPTPSMTTGQGRVNIQGIPTRSHPMMQDYQQFQQPENAYAQFASPAQQAAAKSPQPIAGITMAKPAQAGATPQAPPPEKIMPLPSQQAMQQKTPSEMTEAEWEQTKRNTPGLTTEGIKEADAIRNSQIKNEALKADIELKRKKDIRDQERAQREKQLHALKLAAPKEVEGYLKELDNKMSKAAANERAYDVAERAIKSGETSGFVQYYANKYGFDPLISTNSALLNQTAKEIVQDSVQRAGQGGKNQWYEKMLKSMFPHPGQTNESAEIGIKHLRFLDVIDRQEAEIANRLSEEDLDKYGQIRRNLKSRTLKELRPYYLKERQKFSLEAQEIMEEKMTDEQMNRLLKVPKGTPLTKRKADIILSKVGGDTNKLLDRATKLGYEIPEQE